MQNIVKLLPPTSERFNADGLWVADCYTDARYTFSKPTKRRNYVRILAALHAFNFHGIAPTRKTIAYVLGEPTRPGWGSSKWAALKQAGLLDYCRRGRTIVYYVTTRGLDFLAQLGLAD